MRISKRWPILCMLFFIVRPLVAQSPAIQQSKSMQALVDNAASYIQKKDFKKAQVMLTDAISKYPSAIGEPRLQAEFLLGFCYENQKSLQEAKQIYIGLIRQHPKTSAAEVSQYRLDIMSGKTPTLNRSIGSDPVKLRAEYQKAKTAHDAAKYACIFISRNTNKKTIKQSEKFCMNFIDRFGYVAETKEVMFSLACAYEEVPLPLSAIATMEKIFKRFPETKNDPRFLIQYGSELNLAGRSKAALRNFQKALLLNPNRLSYAIALEGIGVSYRDQRMWSEAEKAYRAAKAASERIGANSLTDLITELQDELKARKAQDTDEDENAASPKSWAIRLIASFFALAGASWFFARLLIRGRRLKRV